MKRSRLVRVIALILALLTLAACGGNGKSAEKAEVELTDKQRQSLAMLNYLTVLTQEIVNDSNNQFFMEEVYLELISNINPDAIDEETQIQLTSLLDSLETFRMLEVARERLVYTYEQERARSLEAQLDQTTGDVTALVLNPEATETEKVAIALKATVSVGRMIFGDVKSEAELELDYKKDGWKLDDQAAEEIHKRRSECFEYMVEIARDNNIPGEYTLTEETVQSFVQWKYDPNLLGRIQYLEAHKETYKFYGDYWLTLATSYYDNGDYEKCIDAVSEYEKLNNNSNIFRQDYNFASVLPMSIVAAREIYDEDKYVNYAKKYLPIMQENARDNDWVNRYFITEIYADLYSKTGDTAVLRKGYDEILNLCNILAAEQRKANEAYLKDLVAVTAGDGASEDKLKETENFNRVITELRKVELPPVSEPLRMSGDMLFALAAELNIPEEEKEKAMKLLHNDGEDLFYNLIYDNAVRMYADETDPTVAELPVKYTEGSVTLPVIMLSENSVVKVSAVGKSKTTVFEDWSLKKVERKENDVETFAAVYKSKKAEDFEYKDGMTLLIEIYADKDAETPDYTVEFKVKVETTLWLFDEVSFKRVS